MAATVQPDARHEEHGERHEAERDDLRVGEQACGDLAARGPRVPRVDARVDQPWVMDDLFALKKVQDFFIAALPHPVR